MSIFDMFSFLKPAPYIDAIEDPKTIAKEYKYWRIRIFYSIYIGYVFYYFTRKSFTFAMPHLIDDLGFSMSDLGFLSTILYISYGISKFASGILSDRSNPRYFMAIGLIITGLTNLCFGLSSSLLMFAIFWGLNGIFQGWGWPPCTKQLTYWFAHHERGFWWSTKSTSHNVGGALIPLLAVFCAQWFGWRYAMFVPGVISILAGFWLMERLRDVPQSLGLPPVESLENSASPSSAPTAAVEKQPTPLLARQILFEHVLNNKGVWILSLSYFFVYVVRTAMNDWGALFLEKAKGYERFTAASSITWFEIGGFLGVLAAGWASDYFFNGRRVPFMIGCALGLIASIVAFWFVPVGSLFLDFFFMTLIGFLVFGPQLLVGLAAAEFVDKKAACTANGFAGCFAYIGAAATGYPLGAILDRWSWKGFFITLIVCSAAIFIILLPLYNRDDNERTREREREDLTPHPDTKEVFAS